MIKTSSIRQEHGSLTAYELLRFSSLRPYLHRPFVRLLLLRGRLQTERVSEESPEAAGKESAKVIYQSADTKMRWSLDRPIRLRASNQERGGTKRGRCRSALRDSEMISYSAQRVHTLGFIHCKLAKIARPNLEEAYLT